MEEGSTASGWRGVGCSPSGMGGDSDTLGAGELGEQAPPEQAPASGLLALGAAAGCCTGSASTSTGA
jgi:hypothetical protein